MDSAAARTDCRVIELTPQQMDEIRLNREIAELLKRQDGYGEDQFAGPFRQHAQWGKGRRYKKGRK